MDNYWSCDLCLLWYDSHLSSLSSYMSCCHHHAPAPPATSLLYHRYQHHPTIITTTSIINTIDQYYHCGSDASNNTYFSSKKQCILRISILFSSPPFPSLLPSLLFSLPLFLSSSLSPSNNNTGQKSIKKVVLPVTKTHGYFLRSMKGPHVSGKALRFFVTLLETPVLGTLLVAILFRSYT